MDREIKLRPLGLLPVSQLINGAPGKSRIQRAVIIGRGCSALAGPFFFRGFLAASPTLELGWDMSVNFAILVVSAAIVVKKKQGRAE